jgi:hypothetical protein
MLGRELFILWPVAVPDIVEDEVLDLFVERQRGV